MHTDMQQDTEEERAQSKTEEVYLLTTVGSCAFDQCNLDTLLSLSHLAYGSVCLLLIGTVL